MKQLLLPAFIFLIFASCLHAQNGIAISMEGTPACGCEGCFIVTVSNAQPPFQVLWSNGMTTTATTNPFVQCGFCPGPYYVTVTNNTAAQTATATGFIDFLSPPQVNIISLTPSFCNVDSSGIGTQFCDKYCAGTTATYSVEDDNNVSGFLNWSVTGATSWSVDQTTGKQITVTWGAPGMGSVQVTSFVGQSCLSEDSRCVQILEPPKAIIGSMPAAPTMGNLQVCKGQTVDFQNLSTGDADNVEWYFPDDLTNSTSETPQHIFQTAGIYTVTLIASSACLCADTTTMTVEVLDAVAPTLDCVGTICPGATVSYSSSNACAPFNWAVSANGTILEGGTASSDSITVQWGEGPVGVITLSAPACSGATCPIGGVVNVPIVSDNAEIRGADRVCPSTTEVYTIDPFGGSGFVWTLASGGVITEGQGTNRISVDWGNTPNTSHWLSVKYTNCYLGCGGQDSLQVRIAPAFFLGGPIEACDMSLGNYSAKIIGSLLPINCNWTVSGPSGATVWTSPPAVSSVSLPFNSGVGQYHLFATPANPNQTCSASADWAVKTVPLPAKLTGIKGERTICPGTTYAYEAEGGGPTSNYFWTVKNGPFPPLSYPGKNLNITWNNVGPYWISVAHVSNDGLACRSDTVLANIAPIGLVSITGTPQLCEDSKGIYTTISLQNVDYQWSITPPTAGSVTSGQGANTAEIFWSQAGAQTVNLNICGQTATFPVTVFPPPDPMVQAPAGLCPGATDLVQTTTPFSAYSWKDDAGTVLATTPSLQLGPGTYAVEVTDANGCVGTKEFSIAAWDAPDVSLTTASPTGFCNNSIFVPLTALINAAGNYTFQWYQDANLIPGETASTYSTNQYGLYTVQATNAHGCTSIAGPILLFPYCGSTGQCTGHNCPGPICPPGTVSMAIDPTARCDSFQMHLLDPNGVYMHGSAEWVMGISGGIQLGSSTDTDPSFTVNNAGEYVAILKVTLTDGSNCHVYDFFGAEAVAQFDILPGCPGEQTNFQDVSEFLPSGGIASYAWEFGDPASGANNLSAIQNAAHTYNPSGNYTVKLTVTGNSGCTSSATAVADIPDLPAITFPDPAQKCAGNALEFAAASGTADITDISWNFGDPASGDANDATGSSVYHRFSPAGNYTVTATATNVYGCTSSFTRNVTVVSNTLSGTITPPLPPTICEGKNITLLAPAGGVSYLWSDDAGTTTPFITVAAEGTFKVTLTDANGCSFSPPAVNVEVNAAPDAIIKGLLFNDLGQIIGTEYPDQTICVGEDISLQTFVNTTSATYQWSVAGQSGPIIYYTDDRNNLLSVGNYTYSVTVTNFNTGCTTVAPSFDVHVKPVPSGFSISGNSVCAGNATTLTYNGSQPPNWQLVWNTGQTGPTLSTDEAGVYQIRVINEFGCEARSNQWKILPGPPVQNIPAGCHTRCNPDTICLPSFPSVTNWQWYHNGSPIPGANTPNFIATQSGTYWAQLTDSYGCTAESGPLSLNLYDGYGNILGQVWSDVNNNGIIDAADTLVSGIPVVLYQNGVAFDNASSNVHGGFAFPNILSTNYLVEVDAASLPSNWHVVIGQDAVPLSGCDVEGQADLLLHYQCTSAASSLQLDACAGTSVTYNGINIPAGTTQAVTFPLGAGCDSVVTVTVLSWPAASSIKLLRACPGGAAVYNGVSIPVGSFHDFTFQTIHGCDSIVEVYVAPYPTSTGAQTLHACAGSAAVYNGVSVPVGTSQNFTLQNWLGCDSIVTVNVQPWPTSSGAQTLHACAGSAAVYNGVSVPVGTSQNFTLQNWLGCDSIVTVNVQPWPTSPNTATLLFACAGSSAVYNGVSVLAGTSQNFTLQNALGCDSVVTVSVAILPPTTGTATLFACPGGAATYNGVSVATGASQQFTLQSWLGCDSIVTVNVQPWPESTGNVTLFACPGGAATYNGTSVPVGTTQQFTLQNWLGCDSIVAVNVQPLAVTTSSATVFACPGSAANFHGTAIPTGATQQVTLQNWLGCDSVVTVTAQAWPTSNSAFQVGVCPGETFNYQGVALSGGAVQSFVLQNWLGCDSTVTVTVKQLQSTANVLQVNVCPGETYVFNGVEIAGGSSKDFKLVNSEGCDSTLTVAVTEFPAVTFTVQAEQSCAGTPTGSLEALPNPGGLPPFRYSLDKINYQDDNLFTDLGTGDYTVYLQDDNGCLFAVNAAIPAIPALTVALPNGILPCDSAAVVLAPAIQGGDPSSLTFKWWNGDTTAIAQASNAGPVWVEVADQCSTERSEAVVEWAELASDLSIVYVPNVMSPTAVSAENSEFRPLFASGISLITMKFEVFDRWGNMLFKSDNPSDGWNGRLSNTLLDPGVQVWYLEADVAICGRIIHVMKKGDVTVVR